MLTFRLNPDTGSYYPYSRASATFLDLIFHQSIFYRSTPHTFKYNNYYNKFKKNKKSIYNCKTTD